ncbi:hypothetical protein AX16_001438 [Volvariella volvacea WC 439]|nr:hypothetical protein AX16_001438 [Volvariella volvacea WC 439]
MSSIAPSSRAKGPQKSGARRTEANKIYANLLPLLFHDPPPSRVKSVVGLLGLSLTRVETPHCEGILDTSTRSVWVTNPNHSMVLWRRGFFGKGDLSRKMTSEEVTAKRRAERRQFKIDRAQAIAAAAAQAEQLFATEGRVVVPALSGPDIPSAATWKPSRPVEDPSQPSPEQDSDADSGEPLEDIEHLRLTLQEAFFLIWNLDCLTIVDPTTDRIMTIQDIWQAFQGCHLPPSPDHTLQLHFDNPFLVHYATYHHYRSLGWVVKSGIKFCADYLLYKRGPVFSHAEFAIVVCPVYEDPEDQTNSPVTLQNADTFNWSWLSTLNRVNSQVQKTLILTYVTIPSRKRVNPDVIKSPACLTYYAIREVVVRRFVPARMRE